MKLKISGKSYLPFVLLGIILLLYFYFWSFLHSDYRPYYGDEIFYYKNSESFYLTHSVGASFTYSGNGAKILGSDAHGPAYPLLYGMVSHIIGWSGLTIPLTNLACLALVTALLLLGKTRCTRIKTLQSILVLGSPITLFYSVTYMPELLHISGAVGLYLLVKRFLGTNSQRDFLILLAYILLLGCIRSTWFFALFGLVILPGPVRGYAKSSFLLAGLALPFLFQYFLHEQVPNAFSTLGELVGEQGIGAVLDTLYLNVKRNVYLGLTYTEGYFYTVVKLWIAISLVSALVFYRKNRVICFGILVLAMVMVFNLVLYKNFSWIELRMYTPLAMFLNLGMLSSPSRRFSPNILLILNLAAFFLILPLQKKLVAYRTSPRLQPIPDRLLGEIKNLDNPLVYIDPALLEDYGITELPTVTTNGRLIRYILPYYEMKTTTPTHRLVLDTDQSTVNRIKILAQ